MTGNGLARSRQSLGAVSVRARRGSPGTAVFAGLEGTRPVLVEIQALVAPTRSARRAARSSAGTEPAVDGAGGAGGALRRWPSGHDVYLNVAGGLRIEEPAADLAAAAALVSSLAHRRARRRRLFRRNVAVRRSAAGGADRGPAQGSGETRLHPGHRAGGGARRSPRGLFAFDRRHPYQLVADIARDGTPARRRVGRQEA